MPQTLEEFRRSQAKQSSTRPMSFQEFRQQSQPEYKPNISKQVLSDLSPFNSSVLNDAKAWEAAGKPGLEPEPTARQEYMSNALQPFKNIVSGVKAAPSSVKNFVAGGGSGMTLGLGGKFDDPSVKATTSYKAGEFVGSLLPIGAAYKYGGKLLTKTFPKLGGLKKLGATGAVAGTATQTGKEAADIAFDTREDGPQTLGERGKNIAIEGALFGGIDLGTRAVSRGAKFLSDKTGLTPKVQDAISRFLEKRKSSGSAATVESLAKQPPTQPTLALPEPRQRGNISQVETPDVINIPETAPRGLPAPDLQPTVARRGVKEQNIYAQKLQQSFDKVNKGVGTKGKLVKPFESLDDNYLKPLSEYTDTLYRETSPKSALDILPGTNVMSDTTMDVFYFSNKTETALGQGNNKGVLIEFDSNKIKGQLNKDKPSWEMAYKSGSAEFKSKYVNQNEYKDSVRSVTVRPDAKMDRSTQIRLNRILEKWNKTSNPDGSVTYTPAKTQSMAQTIDGRPLLPRIETGLASKGEILALPEPPPLRSTSQPAREFTGDQGLTLAQRQADDSNPLLRTSGDWKNKATFSLKRETMERNFDDIMGKEAPAMKETYLEPIKVSESARTRVLNQQRNDVRNLGIKYKSKEDKLVQMYGEQKITLDELKASTKDWKKVVKATEVMRNKYNELYGQLNKALTDNGYDAIPKRKDYFPHYEEIDNMFTKLGFDIKNFELPTEIIGRTQDFKPGKSFFGNLLKRKGDKTTFGFLEGFDRYIEGATRVIHHTKNIKNLRKLENEIRAKYADDTHLGSFVTDLQDYTNNLAGKQSALDRGIESALGRKVYSVLDAARRKVSLNMIGGNVAAAMTNAISATHALATTNKKAFMEGLYESVINTVKKDGFVDKSNFLTRRYGSDSLKSGLLQKSIDTAMVMMRESDRFFSNVIVRSKYKEGLAKGMPEKEALRAADDWAAKILSDRSLGQMPTYFNSKAMGPILQFQLEVNNQLSFLLKDIPRHMNKKQAISALSQVAVFSYLLNEGYEKMFGRRVALDPIGTIVKAIEDFTNPELSKGKAVRNTVTGILEQLPFTGMLTGGRIPLSAAVPDLGQITASEFSAREIGKQALKPLTYLGAPVAGGQVKKTIEGLTAMGKNPLLPQELPGLYQENPKGEKYLKFPIENSLANKLRAPIFGKYSTPESKEYYDNNRRPLSPKQTKTLERKGSLGRNVEEEYNKLQINRRIDTLSNKKSDIIKDREMSREKKAKEIEKINKLIRELRSMR